jgi:MFS family permease
MLMTTRSAARPVPPAPMAALLTSTALMNASMAAASAASSMVAADQLGAGWGGLPNAGGVIGTGLGAVLLTAVMRRAHRRAGLRLGYAAATLGGALGVAAVPSGNVVALCLALLLIGLGNAGAQLSRYVAAELYPVSRHGFAISMLMWSGAVGAVSGPLLFSPLGRLAGALGWPPLTGAFLLSATACVGALLAARATPATRQPVTSGGTDVGSPLRALLRLAPARTALTVMVTGQLVMVIVMTATPVDMNMHGQSLGMVGATLSAHTFGMFAFSPLTGRLIDGHGTRPVLIAGVAALAASTTLVTLLPEHASTARMLALFLLGYAWNLCFTGGSTQLSRELPPARRAALEGAADAAIWSLAALAALSSTLVLSTSGDQLLAAASTLLALPAAALLCTDRRATHSGTAAAYRR